ncbi:hypothetical protein VDG37_01610 [Xanthomonas campestris pv. raphani]|uniref:hypothetical protein n=1 Tax=Xanthomonas campestris TaxID=339 RepID=UPI002B225272|nr:hypothetical protein [Xanthomonas campestris]MEA9830476.1 hypothetical protein [Xanthomonas campestris pv. raphani]MEA9951453.1 hypothetical protein [Xanthomonas campestris pv. raphani]
MAETAVEKKEIGSAHVLAWGSVFIAFGAVQGVIYLRSYWGNFGVDPFQFGSVNDLALVGLTAIGATLAFLLLSSLVGGYLGRNLSILSERYRTVAILVPIALLIFLIALALYVDLGFYLVFGVFLTWILIWLIQRTPGIPISVRQMELLPYIALVLAYMPLSAHYLGHRKAASVKRAPAVVSVLTEHKAERGAKDSGKYQLAGRLGDVYVLYHKVDDSIEVIPSSELQRLRIERFTTPPGSTSKSQ